MTSCTSSSEISRSEETTGCTPRLLKPRTWPPVTPEIDAADFDIGHLLGLDDGVADVLLGQRAHRQISPLRTPRERAWPRPTMFRAPSALESPTTAQTLEVPISSPTMMEEGSNMFFPGAQGFGWLGSGGRDGAGFEPAGGDVVGDRQIERGNRLARASGPARRSSCQRRNCWSRSVEAEGDFAALPGRDDQHFRARTHRCA